MINPISLSNLKRAVASVGDVGGGSPVLTFHEGDVARALLHNGHEVLHALPHVVEELTSGGGDGEDGDSGGGAGPMSRCGREGVAHMGGVIVRGEGKDGERALGCVASCVFVCLCVGVYEWLLTCLTLSSAPSSNSMSRGSRGNSCVRQFV